MSQSRDYAIKRHTEIRRLVWEDNKKPLFLPASRCLHHHELQLAPGVHLTTRAARKPARKSSSSPSQEGGPRGSALFLLTLLSKLEEEAENEP